MKKNFFSLLIVGYGLKSSGLLTYVDLLFPQQEGYREKISRVNILFFLKLHVETNFETIKNIHDKHLKGKMGKLF